MAGSYLDETPQKICFIVWRILQFIEVSSGYHETIAIWSWNVVKSTIGLPKRQKKDLIMGMNFSK